MNFSPTRIKAILRNELRDYRRNRFIVYTMSLLPLIFIAAPIAQLFTLNVAIIGSKFNNRIGVSLLDMLILPAIIPSILAAYSVIGEREQGTLEPILTTPIRAEEFLIAKALAVFIPTIVVSYFIFGIFLGAVAVFAHPIVAATIFERNHILTQLVFTPLISGWSIWTGIAISTYISDVRAAQQLTVLASLPPLVIVILMNFNIIAPSLSLALGLAVVLFLIDTMAWRFVTTLFNRERLITGKH
ncbi:MAG: ABC transporter permease [Firmicutes bacterium]|nr:ABC transporter permease [Bacillota bacterium]